MDVLDETPYRDGQTFCVEEVEEAKAWARLCMRGLFVCLGVAGVLAAGLVYVAVQVKVKPYYIIEQADGTARLLGPAPETYSPKQEAIKRELREFITALRGRPMDKVLLGKTWSETGIYAHVTARARKLLNQYVATQDPLSEKTIVNVEFDRLLQQSEKSYDVRWTEKRYNQRLELLSAQAYSGLFTWVRHEPTTEAQIQQNPLGIFVDYWSLSEVR